MADLNAKEWMMTLGCAVAGAALVVYAFNKIDDVVHEGSGAPRYGMPSSGGDKASEAKKIKLISNHLRKRNPTKKPIKTLELTSYEYYILKDVVLPEEVECSFAEIGGLDEIKQDIYEALIVPLNLPQGLMKGKLVQVPKGLLLYGPPGTGKTMMAKAIAKTNQCIFINFSPSSIYQMWYGQSEKILEAFFTLAEKLQPSILFIDEIDTLIPKRGQTRNDLEKRLGGMMMR